MKAVQHGTTDVSTVVRFLDSTTFLPLTGLTDASSGLTLGYRRTGGSPTSITPASLAAPNAAHSDGGFEELANGWYRLDLPDAACASGADEVLIYGTVTGGVMLSAPIALVAYAPQTVAVGAYTGTPPTIEEIAGEVWSSATRALTDKADFTLSSAAISAIEAALVNEGDSTALLQAIADKIAGDLTAGDLTALAIVSAIKTDETLAQMIARIDASVSSRLATAGYTAPLNAADTRSAIGLASANLDTQLSGIATTQSSHTSSLSAISSGVATLLSRITSTLFSGITSLGQWLGAMSGKQTADETALNEINNTGAGSGTFSSAADSLEAIRDRGDSAWTTGSGGSGSVSISITPLKGQQEQRVIDSDLVGYINDRSSVGTIAVTEDDEITPVDVSAFSANARIWIEPSSGTGTRHEVTPTVSGDDGNLISFTLPAAVVAAKSTWLWSLRDITGASAGEGRHVIGGTLTIKRAARAPE